VLPKQTYQNRMPAALEFPLLGDILRRAEAAHLSPAVRMAHRLCAFSVARISNVVQAEWSEFRLDGDPPIWIIPRAKLKARDRSHDHRVILSSPFASELSAWRSVVGEERYLFPSPSGRAAYLARVDREGLSRNVGPCR
jgi:integrase